MQIQGSTFLISGGSSGLGAACVRTLARSGARGVIADLNSAGGEARAAESGPEVQFVRMEVTDEASVQNAVDTAVQGFGALRGVVNGAGIGNAERVLGKTGPHSWSTFSKVISVNLIATFNVPRLAAAAISRAEPRTGGERGIIINT